MRSPLACILAAVLSVAYWANGANHANDGLCSDQSRQAQTRNQRSEAQDQKALVVELSHSILGVLTTTISSRAIRIDMQTPRGAYLVAKAPEWRVVLFNSEENLGMEMPFKQYLDHHARWSYGHRAGFGVPTTEDIGRVNYAGRVCEKVGVVQVSANGVVDRAQRHSNIIYYAADEPGVPQQASQILEKFIGAPLHKGVALYIDDEVNKASDRSMLATAMPLVTLVVRTRQISDRTCSAHLFDYPSNFKKVAYEAEVRYSSKSRKDIEELLK